MPKRTGPKTTHRPENQRRFRHHSPLPACFPAFHTLQKVQKVQTVPNPKPVRTAGRTKRRSFFGDDHPQTGFAGGQIRELDGSQAGVLTHLLALPQVSHSALGSRQADPKTIQ